MGSSPASPSCPVKLSQKGTKHLEEEKQIKGKQLENTRHMRSQEQRDTRHARKGWVHDKSVYAHESPGSQVLGFLTISTREIPQFHLRIPLLLTSMAFGRHYKGIVT